MKTILAPTNFTPESINAVNYAADMACVTGCNLLLLHICRVPVVLSAVPVHDSAVEQIAYATQHMKLLKESIRDRTGEHITVTSKIDEGAIAVGIEKVCRAIEPYAVVMGPEKADLIDRIIVGGNTVSAVRKLHWPVMVVPASARFTSIQKIGLACDYRDVIETLPTNEIRQMVKALKASLHVLHISSIHGEMVNAETIAEARWLHEILADLHPTYHYQRGENVEEAIIQFADKHEIDLLMIIPKKHHFLSALFQHEHSRKLVLQTHIPLMALH